MKEIIKRFLMQMTPLIIEAITELLTDLLNNPKKLEENGKI